MRKVAIFLVSVFCLFTHEIAFSKEHLTQWTDQQSEYYPMDMVDLMGYMGSPEEGGMLDLRFPLWALPRTLFFGDFRLRGASKTKELDAGLAIRRALFENSPWNFVGGLYGFYRRMRSPNQKYYTAINPGFELLSDGPEFRANGYFSNPKSCKFDEEQFITIDDLGTTTTTNYTREWAPSGFDVEGGWKFRVQKKWDIGLYGGYFRYHRKDSGTATGPIARILVTRQDFLVPGGRFEMGGKAQPIGGQRPIIYGYARVSMPIYSKKPNRPLNNLDYLMAQPIYNELAILTKEKRFSNTLSTLGDASFPIIFVTANGTGNGTRSSPASLVTAEDLMQEGDVLFLLNDDGDISVTVLDDDTLDLMNNVQLLGIGDGTTRNVTVGSQTISVSSNTGRPTLNSTNNAESVVQLASGNTVSGFDIDGGLNGVYGVSETGATITNMGFSNQVARGIFLEEFDGAGVAIENIFFETTAIAIALASPTGTYTIENLELIDIDSIGIDIFKSVTAPAGDADITITGTTSLTNSVQSNADVISVSDFNGTLDAGDWTATNALSGINTQGAIGTVTVGDMSLASVNGDGLNLNHSSGDLNVTGTITMNSGNAAIVASMSSGATATINSLNSSGLSSNTIDIFSNEGTITINGGVVSNNTSLVVGVSQGTGTANFNNMTMTASGNANAIQAFSGNGEVANFTGCTISSEDGLCLSVGDNVNGSGAFTNCSFTTTGQGTVFSTNGSGTYDFNNCSFTFTGNGGVPTDISNYSDITVTMDTDCQMDFTLTDANAGSFFVGGVSGGNGSFTFNDVTATCSVANNGFGFTIQDTDSTDSFTFRNISLTNFNGGVSLSGPAPVNITSATITDSAAEGLLIGSSNVDVTIDELNVENDTSGAVVINPAVNSDGSVVINGGTLSDSGSKAVDVLINGSGTMSLVFSNLSITNPADDGISIISSQDGANANVTMNNNTISNVSSGGNPLFVSNGAAAGTSVNLDINNNNFTNPGDVTYTFDSVGGNIGLVGSIGVSPPDYADDNGNLANNGNESNGGAPVTDFAGLPGNNITIINALP